MAAGRAISPERLCGPDVRGDTGSPPLSLWSFEGVHVYQRWRRGCYPHLHRASDDRDTIARRRREKTRSTSRLLLRWHLCDVCWQHRELLPRAFVGATSRFKTMHDVPFRLLDRRVCILHCGSWVFRFRLCEGRQLFIQGHNGSK